MNQTQKIIVSISLILALMSGVALANPQILTFTNGFWLNDRGEDRNSKLNDPELLYTEISEDTIEVIYPILKYDSDMIYSNGEQITISIQGAGTMTLTANQPISISVIE